MGTFTSGVLVGIRVGTGVDVGIPPGQFKVPQVGLTFGSQLVGLAPDLVHPGGV